MIKINFYARERKNQTITIYVQFYIERKKINFSTEISCAPEHWDADKMQVTKVDRDHADKNLLLESIRSRINKIEVNYRLKNRLLTRDLFLRAYNRPDDFQNFFDYVKEYSLRQ